MKIHFGIMVDCGTYENPSIGCEKTLCGCNGEIPCETAVEDWRAVTCKKCLKLHEAYKISVVMDEKHIVDQMGEMSRLNYTSG